MMRPKVVLCLLLLALLCNAWHTEGTLRAGRRVRDSLLRKRSLPRLQQEARRHGGPTVNARLMQEMSYLRRRQDPATAAGAEAPAEQPAVGAAEEEVAGGVEQSVGGGAVTEQVQPEVQPAAAASEEQSQQDVAGELEPLSEQGALDEGVEEGEPESVVQHLNEYEAQTAGQEEGAPGVSENFEESSLGDSETDVGVEQADDAEEVADLEELPPAQISAEQWRGLLDVQRDIIQCLKMLASGSTEGDVPGRPPAAAVPLGVAPSAMSGQHLYQLMSYLVPVSGTESSPQGHQLIDGLQQRIGTLARMQATPDTSQRELVSGLLNAERFVQNTLSHLRRARSGRRLHVGSHNTLSRGQLGTRRTHPTHQAAHMAIHGVNRHLHSLLGAARAKVQRMRPPHTEL